MLNSLRSLLVLMSFVALVSTAGQTWAVEVDPISPGSWTMVILPDTQRYSLTYPQIFYAQTQWIADHKDTHNIQMVLHEGDITHTKTTTEFARAKTAMNTLSAAGVPYSICAGNHDYDLTTRDSLFNNTTYFGPGSAYATQSHIGGFFESGKTDNSYSTFNASGRDWLVFSVEFGPRDEVITWMDTVAAAHPSHHFILNTHAYLYSDDTRYDWATYGAAQEWNPHDNDELVSSGTSINDGQELWDKLVKKYENWKFTFNGHVLNDGTGWLGSLGNNGNVVHQILANYQFRDNGGDGYLRIMEFMADGDTVKVSSYSPYQGAYLTSPDQDFTLKMSKLPSPPPALVWRMDFETQNGVPVTHGQALAEAPGYQQDGTTETEYDPNGGARNTEGSSVSWYAGYAHPSVPPMPGDMVASGERGNFAFRAGNNIWRMASQIPCTWGDSNKFHTIEGFFNNQEDLVTTLVGEYDLMKRAFIQTKRSSTDYKRSRLWVGMGVKSDPLEEGNDVPVLALMYATVPDPDVSFISVLGDTEIVPGDWHHFALVLDTYDVEGTEMSDLTVYLDGREEISVLGLTNLYPAGTKCFTLGEAWTTGNESGAESFNGYLDAVRVTNAALLPGQFLYVPIPGDATRDGQVNQDDAARLAEHWGETELSDGLTWWELGDFNGDETVGAADAAILAANWGYGPGEAGSVPEPSTLGLLLVLPPMLSFRRRHRCVSGMLCRGQ